jgi:hypothetical protein
MLQTVNRANAQFRLDGISLLLDNGKLCLAKLKIEF